MAGLADFEAQENNLNDEFGGFITAADAVAQEEGLQEVEESAVDDFPTLESMTSSPEFQSINRFDQRTWLEGYKQDYMRHLVNEGLVQGKEERKETESLIDDAIKPHITSSPVGDFVVGAASTNPGLEMVQGAASIAQTFQEWRQQYVRTPFRVGLQESIDELGEVRQGASDVIAEDPTRRGRNLAVEEQGLLSGAGMGQIINKIGGDAPAMAAGFMLGGPAGAFVTGSYFAADAAGRIDVRSRAAEEAGDIPKRSAGERLVRAGAGGVLSAALETFGVGKVLGSFRKHMAGNAFNRVAAAAGAETATEMFQGIIEDTAISAEDKDDFILIAGSNLISTEKWKEGLAGALVGGPISAVGEAARGNLNRKEFDHFLDQNKAFLKKHKRNIANIVRGGPKLDPAHPREAAELAMQKQLAEAYGVKDFDFNAAMTEPSGITEEGLLDQQAVELQVSGLPEGDGLKEGDILSERGAEVQEFGAGQETGISKEGVLTKEEARAQGEATLREDAERNLSILMQSENFVKDNNIKDPKDLASYLFRSGEFDRMTGIIDDLTNGEADAEGIVAKAINRQFTEKSDKDFAIDPPDTKEQRAAKFHQKEKAKADKKRKDKKDKLAAIVEKVKVERSGRGTFQGIPDAPAKTGIKEGDFFTAEEAKARGEDTPANPTLTGPDPVIIESPLTLQAKIRESVEEQGGIDTSSPEGKDSIKTVEGKLAISPRYQGTKESFTIDQHIEIAKAKGIVAEDVTNEQFVEKLQGKVSDLKQEVESRPSLELLKSQEQDVPASEIAPDEDFFGDPTEALPTKEQVAKVQAAKERATERKEAKDAEAPLKPVKPRDFSQFMELATDLETNAEVKKDTSRKIKDIAKIVENDLQIPIGKMERSKKNQLGVHKRGPRAIRTKFAEDLTVIAHEVGHGISNQMGLNKSTIGQFDSELFVLAEAQAGPEAPVARRREEGRAEYMRLRLTDPNAATAIAPDFDAEFNKRLAEFPEIEQGLDKLTAAYGDILAQTPQQRTKASQGRDRKATTTFKQFIDKTLVENQDRKLPFRNLMGRVYGNIVIPYAKDTYRLSRVSEGSADIANFYFQDGIHHPYTNEKMSDGLEGILKPIQENELLDFEGYMKDRRIAIDLKPRGIRGGPIDSKSAESVAKYEREFPHFKEVAQDMKGFTDAMLDWMVESGILSEEQRGRIKGKNNAYIPLARIYDEVTKATLKTSNNSNPLQVIKGDTASTGYGLPALENNLLMMVKAGFDSLINKSLIDAANREKNLVEKDLGGVGKYLEIVGSDKIKGENIFTVYDENGKATHISIKDDLLWDAMTYSPVMKGSVSSMNEGLANFAAKTNRVLKRTAVGSLNFVTRNLVTDPIQVAIQSKNFNIPYYQSIRGAAILLSKKFPTVASFMKIDPKMLGYYKASGAGQSTYTKVLNERISKVAPKGEKGKAGAALEWLDNQLIKMEKISQFAEETTRAGEFELTFNRVWDGESQGIQEAMGTAAFETRDHMDYSKMGTSVAGDGLLSNRYVAFLNPAIQGTHKVLETIMTSNKGRIGIATLVILPEILQWLALSDDEDYLRQSEDNRREYIYIRVGEGAEGLIKIKKPLGYQFFGNLVRKQLFSEGSAKERLGMANEQTWNAVKGQASSMIPSVIKPIAEYWTNYSFFREAPIISEYLKNKPKQAQFTKYTSETAKFISRETGGMISPIFFDHMVTGYFTNWGKFGTNVIDSVFINSIEDSIPKPTPELGRSALADAFGVRRFFATNPDAGAAPIVEMYKLSKQISGLKTTIKNADTDLRQSLMSDPENARLLRMDGRVRSTRSNVRSLMKQADFVMTHKTMSPDVKKAKLRKIYDKAATISSETVNFFKKN